MTTDVLQLLDERFAELKIAANEFSIANRRLLESGDIYANAIRGALDAGMIDAREARKRFERGSEIIRTEIPD